MKKTLADALEERGYSSLTAVQQEVTNPDVTGQDLLVSAQTGSGKTLAFGLAIAPGLLGNADHFERASLPLALIIAPTRELALQVKRELAWLFEKSKAVVASTVGGMDMRDERRALSRGAHIVVATPGRLRDHIMRGSIDLSALKAVVLDEADEMLDLGFREDLEFILDEAPEDRQTLLFSATVPNSIAKLAKSYQKDAVRIATTSGEAQHADIAYQAFKISPRDTENAIINVLRFYEAPNAIVFCNTRATVNRLTTRLSNRGFSVVALSGELSQNERTHALQAMRDGRARVCVATDVAARGIDLPNLELVIHAELPTNQETLLHRSGRTGRAGRKGVSALIVPPSSRRKAERLLGWAKLTADWQDAPNAKAVSAKDEERMLSNPAWLEPIAKSDNAAVEKLTEQFTSEQIALAYLRLYRERHTAPEELSSPKDDQKPRKEFGATVWFSIEGGRAAGADPRRLLPMLCKLGSITKDDIGAIRIQPNETFFELRKQAVGGFLKAIGSAMTVEDNAALRQLDGKPKLDKSPRRSDTRRRSDRKSKETGPIDWNDDPKPRNRKPKGGGKTTRTKKRDKIKDQTVDGSGAKNWKSSKSDDGRPKRPKGDKKDRPGGPKPPAGKPSSKKNRARKLAAKMRNKE